MDTNIKVTRCPRCGGVHLTGVAEKSTTSGNILGGMLLFGFIGAIVSVFKALIGLGKGKKPSGYWKCLDCGTTFPMD